MTNELNLLEMVRSAPEFSTGREEVRHPILERPSDKEKLGVDPIRLAKVRREAPPEVATFLMPIDGHDAYLRAFCSILHAIKTDTELRKAADAILRWVGQPLDPTVANAFASLRRPGTTRLATFLEVAYLRALNDFEIDPSKALQEINKGLSNSAEIRNRVESGIRKMPSTFIAQLLLETEVRAVQSVGFAQRLQTAQIELRGIYDFVMSSFGEPISNFQRPEKLTNGDEGGSGGIIANCSTADDGTVCYIVAGTVLVLAILCFIFC